jgi:signal transduction histidine kinase
VKRLALTARARLTLLYTSLFVGCGAVVVAITYGLVASSVTDNSVKPTDPATAQFLAECKAVREAAKPLTTLDDKCNQAVQEAVKAGVLSQRETLLNHLLTYSLATLAAVTLLAALAGWIVAGQVLRPVHRITAAARAASEHNLSQRVAMAGPHDELRALADTFDDMLARLEGAFAGQRRFIANASHELRTPLTVMRTTVDVVLAKPAPTTRELTAMGEDIRDAVAHAEALIEALLALARNDAGLTVREPVDLATVAEDALDGTGLAGLTVVTALRPAVAYGDPVLLERLVANLVDNAVRYNVEGGTVAVTTSTVDSWARIVVSNTGPVIEPGAVPGLFEPFRRLHERTGGTGRAGGNGSASGNGSAGRNGSAGGNGVGLGLTIVASIASIHAGTVGATASPGGGLEVVADLPTVRASHAP